MARINERHGGARPLPLRTIEQWMEPRAHSDRRYRNVGRFKGKFRATVRLRKKLVHLGDYTRETEAAEAVKRFIYANYEVLPS